MIGRKSPLELCFQLAAMISGGLIIAVFLLMLYLAWPLLEGGEIIDLLRGEWQPTVGKYGIYPMLLGSMQISILAVCISLPLSLGSASVITVLAPRGLRPRLLGMVRLMAGVPTVVYGFVAIFLLVPFMREMITGGSGFSILTAALILALLIAPTMITLFISGLQNVPAPYSRAADALGARPIQRLLYVLLPQCLPAISAGIILGLGRAMGDTLISLMLAGNSIAVPESITEPGRSLTSHIALVIAADFSSMEFKTIFACALVLYLFTLLFVATLHLISSRVGKNLR
ncbi:PstC family ABC transporter permease [Desulfotalea psychrophila]|uniref:Related to phosphate ABC-transporter, permease protein n=1 Tax=Desulfotalea psychrophila (strain LSv54 / DSM 12343) TaxID=177439 RepID=Q6ANW4_DESPS|nr:ABC transporter permease subunit [Desulfotalea psychrophila]CAG35960.1 related to phosphate ABC-transporter, permease protein [Desulfotalea psychrophila LSv54]